MLRRAAACFAGAARPVLCPAAVLGLVPLIRVRVRLVCPLAATGQTSARRAAAACTAAALLPPARELARMPNPNPNSFVKSAHTPAHTPRRSSRKCCAAVPAAAQVVLVLAPPRQISLHLGQGRGPAQGPSRLWNLASRRREYESSCATASSSSPTCLGLGLELGLGLGFGLE